MLSITNELIGYLNKEETDYSIIQTYIKAISKYGKLEDAERLLIYFLDNPGKSYSNNLLDPLFKFGHEQHGRLLLEKTIIDKELNTVFSEEILHFLGYIGLEEALDVLIYNAFEVEDYYINQKAILGLLHLDCTGKEAIIKEEIEACFGKNWFNEFVPALACKLEHSYDYLQHFYTLGSTVVSTDCNAGIVLAFSLCGEAGRPFLKEVIWNARWECCGGGTGTDYWTFIAMQNLGVTISELYLELAEAEDTNNLTFRVTVLEKMLRHKLRTEVHPFKFVETVEETFYDLYKHLYSNSNPKNNKNITGLVADLDQQTGTNLRESFSEIRHLILGKIEQELGEKGRFILIS